MSSYFWRNPIQQQIILGLLRGLYDPDGTVRFLDVGCSSGEMLLSYAMLLADEYGDEWPERFAITAIDHDARQIEHFTRGLWTANRLYRMPLSYRDRAVRTFDLPAAHGKREPWAMLKSTALVRQLDVRCQDFGHFESRPATWDVCHCQNTLLHLPLQRALGWVEKFAAILRPGGYFFCAGHHNERGPLSVDQLKKYFDPVPHNLVGVYNEWTQRKTASDPAIQLAQYDPADPDLAYKIGSIFRRKE